MRGVALFVTCLVDQLYPQIGEAAVRVLERAGCAVSFPEAQTCCGQAVFNDGFQDDARRLARRFLDAFEGAEVVVAPSGSCVAMVREWYPRLFDGDGAAAKRARGLAHRTFELSEYLVRVLRTTDVGARFPAAVTYHSSCHGLRGLGLREEPLRLREQRHRGHRLAHAPEHEPVPLALERDRHNARACLEPDLRKLHRRSEHERRPEHRMPGEGDLAHRREDAQARVPTRRRRVDEDGLREAHLTGERLQPPFRDPARVREDSELVPLERRVGEDVGDDVAEGRHHCPRR